MILMEKNIKGTFHHITCPAMFCIFSVCFYC